MILRRWLGMVVAGGIAGGAAANVAMLVTFLLLGMGLDGSGFLLDPALQSDKLIAVWTRLQPLPRVMTHPLLMGLGMGVMSAIRSAVYVWISPVLPRGVIRRGLAFGALVWGVVYVFWEFFTPFNMLGEPLYMTAVELVFWAVVACAEGLAIAAVVERLRRAEEPTDDS